MKSISSINASYLSHNHAHCPRAHLTSRPLRFTSHVTRASSSHTGDLPVSTPSIVTDETVPEEHRGLHSYLYDDNNNEDESFTPSSPLSSYTFRDGQDDGSTLIDIDSFLDSREGERPVGVYAIYDHHRNLQFVSFSRNVVLSVKSLSAKLNSPTLCAYVRIMVFANRAMQSKSALRQQADNWIEEAGHTPPGNSTDADRWMHASVFDPEIMSTSERTHYEDKKQKLQRAMGENKTSPLQHSNGTDNGVSSIHEADERRRQMMKNAMEKGDWSEVIDAQTQETLGRQETLPSASHTNNTHANNTGNSVGVDANATQQQIVTPFARASVHRSIGNASPREHHSTNNGTILDNDNNNNVHDTTTTSTSSITTNATTKKKTSPSAAAEIEMTVDTVDRVLDEVRPYLIADGGNVTVVSVSQDGVVALELQGNCGSCPSASSTMKMGIERSLKAAFGGALKEVVQVGGGGDGGPAPATASLVDSHLNMLRGAIAAYGGSIEVIEVSSGEAILRYDGPKPIGYGVMAAIKDKFKDITTVIMLDKGSGDPIEF